MNFGHRKVKRWSMMEHGKQWIRRSPSQFMGFVGSLPYGTHYLRQHAGRKEFQLEMTMRPLDPVLFSTGRMAIFLDGEVLLRCKVWGLASDLEKTS